MSSSLTQESWALGLKSSTKLLLHAVALYSAFFASFIICCCTAGSGPVA